MIPNLYILCVLAQFIDAPALAGQLYSNTALLSRSRSAIPLDLPDYEETLHRVKLHQRNVDEASRESVDNGGRETSHSHGYNSTQGATTAAKADKTDSIAEMTSSLRWRRNLTMEEESDDPHLSNMSIALRILIWMVIVVGLNICVYLLFVTGETLEIEAKDKVVGFCFYTVFVEFAIYSSVIPDTLSWTQRIDDQPAFSGYLIGAFMICSCFGYILLTVMNQRNTDWSVVHAKALNTVGGSISIIGTIIFTFYGAHGEETSETLFKLALGRCICGFGAGISLASTRVMIMKIVLRKDLVMTNTTYTFWLIIGQAMGSVCASMGKLLFEVLVGHHAVAYAIYSVWAVCGLQLVAYITKLYATCCLPSKIEDMIQTWALASGGSTHRAVDYSTHRVIIYCCVFVCAARSVASSGLPAATSMIMERDFGWSQNRIGFFISICYLMAIPIRIIHTRYKHCGSERTWMRIYMALTLVGCILLFETFASWVYPGSQLTRLVFLIVGDCIMLPCMLYVGGMVEGTANSHSLTSETYFTITHIVLYCKVASNVAGYGLGPTIARWFLSGHNQDIYALQQATLTVATILALELAFHLERTMKVLA
jgi:hypothetical protein